MTAPNTTNRKQAGFTLVELVIVILILGILAAVAAPRMFDTANEARASATRHSLSVVRNAVQLFRAENGALPGELGTEADFKADIEAMLNGPFPRAEIGNPGNNVRIVSATGPLTAQGSESWAFNSSTGEFICNHPDGADW